MTLWVLAIEDRARAWHYYTRWLWPWEQKPQSQSLKLDEYRRHELTGNLHGAQVERGQVVGNTWAGGWPQR